MFTAHGIHSFMDVSHLSFILGRPHKLVLSSFKATKELEISFTASRAADDERLDSFETCRADKQLNSLAAARLACTIVPIVLCNTVYYAVLLMMND